MALAYTRLDHRCQRPGIELTQDLVEANLVKEIHELRNVVANLQQMLREVRDVRFVVQDPRVPTFALEFDLICSNNNFFLVIMRFIGRGVATLFAQNADSTRGGHQREDEHFEN